LFFRIEIVKKVIGVTITLGASGFGILAIAWAQVLIGVIAFFVNTHYTGIFLKYGAKEQLCDLAPCCMAGILMAAMLWYVQSTILLNPLAKLSILVGVGMGFYIGVAWIFRFVALEILINGSRVFHDRSRV
jgi:hypothetical protein